MGRIEGKHMINENKQGHTAHRTDKKRAILGTFFCVSVYILSLGRVILGLFTVCPFLLCYSMSEKF